MEFNREKMKATAFKGKGKEKERNMGQKEEESPAQGRRAHEPNRVHKRQAGSPPEALGPQHPLMWGLFCQAK